MTRKGTGHPTSQFNRSQSNSCFYKLNLVTCINIVLLLLLLLLSDGLGFDASHYKGHHPLPKYLCEMCLSPTRSINGYMVCSYEPSHVTASCYMLIYIITWGYCIILME